MLGRQAKTLSPDALARVLARVELNVHAKRDRVMVLLSVRAGLRACEIANLTWDMVLDAKGRVADTIDVRSWIAKKQSGRRIPMHGEVKNALRALKRDMPSEHLQSGEPIIRSAKGGAMRANSIVNWFVALYGNLGLEGCSSHSGRRTFITNAARRLHQAGASLRDVQMLAGHKSIEMTQRYIDGDTQAQRKLVALI